MLQRELDLPPRHIYPVDPWRLVEKRFNPKRLAQFETLFSVSNGYLGIRGAHDEGDPAHQNATLVNGFHETWPIVYGEEAYGFARTGQTIVNVPDAKLIKLYVDDEPFYLPTAEVDTYERCLDMRTGVLERRLIWETAAGKRVSIESRRLVSLEHRHLAAIDYRVTLLEGDAPVVISSELALEETPLAGDVGDPRVARAFAERVLRPRISHLHEGRLLLAHTTAQSGMTVASGVDHIVDTECVHTCETGGDEDQARLVITADARVGQPIRVTKFISYHTTRRVGAEELCARAERTLDRGVTEGFESLAEGQRRSLDAFWSHGDIEIQASDDRSSAVFETAAEIQQVLRLNLFHTWQAAVRAEGAGIPAKGLTGLGYEGHYFWDTEIYVLPFLLYTEPRVARALLRHRYSQLDQARSRAEELSQRGALFPWRSINGEEASAYYAAGTAQYHINADIAHAVRKYCDATGDEGFLVDEGAEILVETARMWRDLGFFSEEHQNRFCIAGVTGPDEYNTVVNNNTFTNLMARENLWHAADTVERMRKEHAEQYASLVHRTGLDAAETAAWREAGDAMFVPYHEKAGIHLQDEEFLKKKPWDFENTPPEKYPLLLHHHPLVIYRHRVIKQADVVLALFLLGDEFSLDEKRRNFDYYDPLTTGDSSLSVSIQSIVAAELGYNDKSGEYWRYAALMDLADLGRNVKDGLHIASMGGTWMATIYGVAGFRDYDGRFSFSPRVPEGLDLIRFCLRLRGQLLQVEMNPREATYTLREGDGLRIRHEGSELRVTPEEPVSRPIANDHADPPTRR